MKYLSVIEEVRTGLQSGVDQACCEHAIRSGVAVGGFIPGGRRAEVFQSGAWTDQQQGIPERLLSAGSFVETTAGNVRKALSALSPDVQALGNHLISKAEHDAGDPSVRTEMQVIFSSATLILSTDSPKLSDGTVKMKAMADRYSKPAFTVLMRSGGLVDPVELMRCQDWLIRGAFKVLNVGGPRASHVGDFGIPICPLAMAVFDLLYAVNPARGCERV